MQPTPERKVKLLLRLLYQGVILVPLDTAKRRRWAMRAINVLKAWYR